MECIGTYEAGQPESSLSRLKCFVPTDESDKGPFAVLKIQSNLLNGDRLKFCRNRYGVR